MPSYETKRIFADNLNSLIARKGITQLDLAIKMGVAASTVSSWCNAEKMPRMDKVEWMAEYFSVPTSFLIETQGEKTNRNHIRIVGRDGSYQERYLTDEQLAMLKSLINQLPDAPEDL